MATWEDSKARLNASQVHWNIEKDLDRKSWGFIFGADVHELAPSSWTHDDPAILPSMTYPEIVNYSYTSEALKSYKGLEASNWMLCGLVKETRYKVISDHCRVSNVNMIPWLVINLT